MIYGQPVMLGGGSARLNISYDTTPPTDTSMLWIPLTKTPVNVEVSGESLQNANVTTDTIRAGGGASVVGSHYPTVAIRDKLYSFGCFSTTYENDILNNAASLKSTEYPYDFSYGCAVAINGKAYIFGGNASAYIKSICEYDPSTDTYDVKTVTLDKSAKNAVAVAINGKAYIFGGSASNTVIQEYDPATNTVATITPETGVLNNYSGKAAVAINGKAYIFGGYSSGAKADIQEYDPVNNTVATMGAVLPTAVRYATAASINGKAYIFGGCESISSSTWYSLVQEYDPANDTCSASGYLDVGVIYPSCAVISDTAYVTGEVEYTGDRYQILNGWHILSYMPKAYLDYNHLKLFASVYKSNSGQIVTNIVNGPKAQIKLVMTAAFLGDADGYAKAQTAFVYDTTLGDWRTLDGNDNYLTFVPAEATALLTADGETFLSMNGGESNE